MDGQNTVDKITLSKNEVNRNTASKDAVCKDTVSKRATSNETNVCPLTYALDLIGGKWRLPIIWALSQNETLRYNELKRKVKGITNMMLAQSLKEMEAYGLVRREQFMEIPPKVEYSLTVAGRDLIPALISLAQWGKRMKNEPLNKENKL